MTESADLRRLFAERQRRDIAKAFAIAVGFHVAFFALALVLPS